MDGPWVKNDIIIEQCDIESVLLEYDIKEPSTSFKVSQIYQLTSLTALKLLTIDNFVNYGIGKELAVKEEIVRLNKKIESVVEKMRGSLEQ